MLHSNLLYMIRINANFLEYVLRVHSEFQEGRPLPSSCNSTFSLSCNNLLAAFFIYSNFWTMTDCPNENHYIVK